MSAWFTAFLSSRDRVLDDVEVLESQRLPELRRNTSIELVTIDLEVDQVPHFGEFNWEGPSEVIVAKGDGFKDGDVA